jgi:23S rRNA pseudouridine955/2504/2580 synthase
MKWSLNMELGSDDEGRRLDRVLRKALKELPLSAIHRALRKGDIRVDGKKKAPEYRCRQGEHIECRILGTADSRLCGVRGQETPRQALAALNLKIIYENDSLLFANKPSGQLVHGSADSLEQAVRGYLEGKLPPSLSFVPGPLHRLDRNSSGILCFSKSLEGAAAFSSALRKGEIGKTYLALLEGRLEGLHRWEDKLLRIPGMQSRVLEAGDSGTINPKAKAASMDILALTGSKELSLALVRLHSGRTHQIRVQSAYHGFPLAGDVKYGAGRRNFPYFLHSFRLSFTGAPYLGLPLSLEAQLPEEFLEILKKTFPLAPEEVYSILRQSNFPGG